jgi:hypothetical protein
MENSDWFESYHYYMAKIFLSQQSNVCEDANNSQNLNLQSHKVDISANISSTIGMQNHITSEDIDPSQSDAQSVTSRDSIYFSSILKNQIILLARKGCFDFAGVVFLWNRIKDTVRLFLEVQIFGVSIFIFDPGGFTFRIYAYFSIVCVRPISIFHQNYH